MIVHAGLEGNCKKIYSLLFYNENELVESKWEVNVQIKIAMILTVIWQENMRYKNANYLLNSKYVISIFYL